LRKIESYKCSNEAYSDGLCKFHNKEYAADKNNKKDMIELLKQKVEENTPESSLKWIGYQIPEISITGSLFKEFEVYLNHACFLGKTDFGSEYIQFNADLAGPEEEVEGSTSFDGFVDFSHATFKGEVTVHAIFNKGLSFYGATFEQRADFTGSAIIRAANFSGTTFNGGAEFRFFIFQDRPHPKTSPTVNSTPTQDLETKFILFRSVFF
jgi:hypothetical protein